MRLSFLSRLFGRGEDDVALALYDSVVAQARLPHWYETGGVPDTIDGRFDMIAAVLSLVLLRLERDPGAAAASARLTERFVSDMDGQLRESGVGDIGVGRRERSCWILSPRFRQYFCLGRTCLVRRDVHEPT
ncbi:MAG: hypothetical protein EOO77_27110 [Oxalobacteraceae bacterium]|nr:MAG: hypothetical protein EOO77_27110 [Oxalobacteraceae bacterium]